MAAKDLLQWLGAAMPFILLIGGWLVNRRLQKANADKVAAEARLAEASVDKAATDVQATILANTKALLAEARTVQAERDAIKEERIATLIGRTTRLENRFESLRTALAAHGVWDAAALIDLRENRPEYPKWPPLALNDHYDDDWRVLPSRENTGDPPAGPTSEK